MSANRPNTVPRVLSIWAKTGSWVHFLSKWPGRKEHTSSTEPGRPGPLPRIKSLRFGGVVDEGIPQAAVGQGNVRLPEALSLPSPTLCPVIGALLTGLPQASFSAVSQFLGDFTLKHFRVILLMQKLLVYGSEAFEICSLEQLRAKKKKALIKADRLHAILSTLQYQLT